MHKQHFVDASWLPPESSKVARPYLKFIQRQVGLGISLGMDIVTAEGATGSYDTCLSSKAKAMCEAMTSGDYDFGMLHVKAVDDAGHDRDLQLKVHLLEQIDKMMGQIIKRLWTASKAEPPLLIVTSDHSTPVCFGDHSTEPVPMTLAFLDKTVRHQHSCMSIESSGGRYGSHCSGAY